MDQHPLQAGTCLPKVTVLVVALSHLDVCGFLCGPTNCPDLYSRIYMDDRSFVSNSEGTFLASVQAWQDWSMSVSLQESRVKTQVTSTLA